MKSASATPLNFSAPAIRAYFSRMHIYLSEMFSLPGHLAIALLAALSITGFSARAQTQHPAIEFTAVIGATWNIFAVLFILRLMDELKDKEIDRKLFPARPLPSGRVLESDIRFSLVVLTALYLLSNLWSADAATSSVFVLGYATLMYKRFFLPELLKGSLAVTLLTHTPIVPLIWIQAFVSVSGVSGIAPSAMTWRWILPFVAMAWMLMLAWELARKIRAPEEETEYVTYSRILGRTGAVSMTWVTQGVAVAICAYLYLSFSLDVAYLLLVGLGWGLCSWAYLRFLLHPDSHTSRLKPYAAVFAFAILAAQVYGFVLTGAQQSWR